MSKEKIFINGAFILEKEFDWGTVLSVSIPEDKIDDVCQQLKKNVKNGWVKLNIGKNRNPTVGRSGKVISTHSLSVDTWEPKQSGSVNEI